MVRIILLSLVVCVLDSSASADKGLLPSTRATLDAALDGDPFPGLDEDPSTANAAQETVKAINGRESVVEEDECLVVRPELRESDLRV